MIIKVTKPQARELLRMLAHYACDKPVLARLHDKIEKQLETPECPEQNEKEIRYGNSN